MNWNKMATGFTGTFTRLVINYIAIVYSVISTQHST